MNKESHDHVVVVLGKLGSIVDLDLISIFK